METLCLFLSGYACVYLCVFVFCVAVCGAPVWVCVCVCVWLFVGVACTCVLVCVCVAGECVCVCMHVCMCVYCICVCMSCEGVTCERRLHETIRGPIASCCCRRHANGSRWSRSMAAGHIVTKHARVDDDNHTDREGCLLINHGGISIQHTYTLVCYKFSRENTHTHTHTHT